MRPLFPSVVCVFGYELVVVVSANDNDVDDKAVVVIREPMRVDLPIINRVDTVGVRDVVDDSFVCTMRSLRSCV